METPNWSTWRIGCLVRNAHMMKKHPGPSSHAVSPSMITMHASDLKYQPIFRIHWQCFFFFKNNLFPIKTVGAWVLIKSSHTGRIKSDYYIFFFSRRLQKLRFYFRNLCRAATTGVIKLILLVLICDNADTVLISRTILGINNTMLVMSHIQIPRRIILTPQFLQCYTMQKMMVLQGAMWRSMAD